MKQVYMFCTYRTRTGDLVRVTGHTGGVQLMCSDGINRWPSGRIDKDPDRDNPEDMIEEVAGES